MRKHSYNNSTTTNSHQHPYLPHMNVDICADVNNRYTPYIAPPCKYTMPATFRQTIRHLYSSSSLLAGVSCSAGRGTAAEVDGKGS